ncbi:MAG: hypothetical protein JW724_06340 [Candidatus Altiarchaeota archaeon]|nr:hypothetical protein [Candidatus Altiarchaeota archaeon]
MKKLKCLLAPVILGGYLLLMNNMVKNNPSIIEKSQTFQNIDIINYRTIKTNVKPLSDINGEESKKIAWQKYFQGEGNKSTLIRQKNNYESYGKNLIIGIDTIKTEFENLAPEQIVGYRPSHDSFGFTQTYILRGELKPEEILLEIEKGNFDYASSVWLNNKNDGELRNSIKDSLSLIQVKKALEDMIKNKNDVKIDSIQRYVPRMSRFSEYHSEPLKASCGSYLEKKLY